MALHPFVLTIHKHCGSIVGCGGRVLGCFAVLLMALSSISCVSPAYKQIDLQAEQLGFARTTQQSEKFNHVVYAKQQNAEKESVNVYIEGDGRAFTWRFIVNADPTSRNVVMLDLMRQDASDTLFVGRPCYFGMALDEHCKPDDWTYARFSEQIVDSMAEVVSEQTQQYQSVNLIGHSGGGALALLLAEVVPNVSAVVTLAGNIDIDAWTKHHRYTRLFGSMNPATRPPLPETIRQLHLVGSKDRVIPPELVKGWVAAQESADLWIMPKYDHSCCWANEWPKVLRWIDQINTNFSPASIERF